MNKIYTVKMPDIGEGVMEGEIIEWLKQPNEPIKQDEPVLVIMTDKATVELPSPYPGKLAKQYFRPGQIAVKDQPLYDIELEQGEQGTAVASSKEKYAPQSTVQAAPKGSLPAPKKIQPSEPSGGKALAIPQVRKFAKDLGVTIENIKGTGPEGRITQEDVISHYKGVQEVAKTPSLAPLPDDEEMPVTGIRNLMAKKMKESKTEIPHFSFFEQADATHLIQAREKFKKFAEKEGIRITYMPFFIKALSLTIKKFPIINSSFIEPESKLITHKQHNIGIAINTERGLIVPVLKLVQEMSLQDIIRSYDALKKKALEGHLHPSDMKNSTISISNFGGLGSGLWATPIINYPEAAILALAKIHKEPAVKGNALLPREVLNLSWSFDHRIIDGDLASKCSHHFITLIQNPAQLL